MLQLGIISELGEGENLGFARVYFDEIEIVSAWLPLPSHNTLNTKHWIPVEVNSQVACLMDKDYEQGMIVMVLWSNPDRPPEWAGKNTYGIQFSDGAEFFYNTESQELTVNAPDSELNFKCKALNVNGEVNITGNTFIKGDTIAIEGEEGMKMKGNTEIDGEVTITKDVTIEGNAKVTGIVKATGDVTGKGVSLSTHTHPTAVGMSGGPIPTSI